MIVSIVVAHAVPSRGIGYKGGLPWHIPSDLQNFRRITMGKTVVMGRKTYESIGKPLEGRRNIVISSTKIEGVTTYDCLEDALYTEKVEEIMIIGGKKLYEDAMAFCDRIYLTKVYGKFLYDTTFPYVNYVKDWQIIKSGEVDLHNGSIHPTQFLIYERRKTI